MGRRGILMAMLILGLATILVLDQLQHISYAQSPATLSGMVVNGTAGVSVIDDLQVTLRFQSSTGDVVERVTSTVDGGAFRFSNLPPQGNPGYVLSTTYLDVEYTNRMLGEPLVDPLEVTVYELTEDFKTLYVIDDTLVLTAVDKKNRQIEILEAVKLRNSSDRTFRTNKPMNLIRFTLPEGATDLDVETSLPGGHIVQVNLGFALTTPIPPGEHDILYVYRVMYKGAVLNYQPHFPMGVESYRVMVPVGLGWARSSDMENAPQATVGDRTFEVLEAKNILTGGRMNLNIIDLPQPSLIERAQNIGESKGFQRGILPALAGSVLAGLLGYTLMRRRTSSSNIGGRDDNPHDELVIAIATLDELFATGDITENEYRQKRDELVLKMRELG